MWCWYGNDVVLKATWGFSFWGYTGRLGLGNTPKAFANFSPGLFQPWVKNKEARPTLKALANVKHALLPTPSALLMVGMS